MSQHNQKPSHISPIVAAWEVGGPRAAARALQRQILNEMAEERRWTWVRPRISFVRTDLTTSQRYGWQPPPPQSADTPTRPVVNAGYWKWYDYRECDAPNTLRSEITRRAEENIRRLPEKIRDKSGHLADLRSVKVIERAWRFASAAPTPPKVTPLAYIEIAARNKAVVIRDVRRVLDEVDKAAETRGGRSKASEILRRLMDRYERDEILFLPDDGSAS